VCLRPPARAGIDITEVVGPELAFQETATTALVRDRLTEYGLSSRTCLTPTVPSPRWTVGVPGETVLLVYGGRS
jgi:metal-dependent amidase/aminoacylase/carboxypeptidase family protein